MSHALFTKTPALRSAARQIAHTSRASYHSTSAPKMPSGTQHLRALIRQTTLRASTTALQRTSYPVSQSFYTQNHHLRSRSPSPPPRYEARNTTVKAPTGQWTRFATTHTLSSVRTFTSSTRIAWPSEASPATTPLSPETQKRVDAIIEEISDMYGTAKDEFEIAAEESEKNSTYAADDRAAAREELDKLLEYYRDVVEGGAEGREVVDEVRRRVGQRIRELEAGIVRMEEEAIHGD
ncbi:hypothetical protein FB567DRAFT_195487 [Paraphoma chrysanthemicola]|uniref:Uncharacterized protein n=1 Tax=Paraphoma chrysanthemicola TaxID=798071 RepID=A0A8K0QV64_9PLEO|nr:hypothetical protein FB567DRAFT_195487 [Paraphoma chrysanthemicola]